MPGNQKAYDIDELLTRMEAAERAWETCKEQHGFVPDGVKSQGAEIDPVTVNVAINFNGRGGTAQLLARTAFSEPSY